MSDPGTPAAAWVVVVTTTGCRTAGEAGPLLAESFDGADLAWVDLALDGASRGHDAVEAALRGIPRDATIGVVAVGDAAEAAVTACSLDSRIGVIALVGASLTPDTARLVTSWRDVPVIAVADASEPDELRCATSLFAQSTHPDRDLDIVTDLLVEQESFGTRVDAWTRAVRTVTSGLLRGLAAAGDRRDLTFMSSDGWEIHGTLTVPARPSAVPAAVLLHSGRSDRAVFGRLERLLARRGVAALSIDWRGRGLSQGALTYFELSPEARAEGWRDAAAAVDALGADPRIDGNRVAMLGVVHGAEHAVAGSIGDTRVRMLGLLTGYVPRSDDERAHLVGGDLDVLYVSCEGHQQVTEAMRALVSATPPGRASLRVYPGGAIGYQLFDIDPGLEDQLASWVAGGLGATDWVER